MITIFYTNQKLPISTKVKPAFLLLLLYSNPCIFLIPHIFSFTTHLSKFPRTWPLLKFTISNFSSYVYFLYKKNSYLPCLLKRYLIIRFLAILCSFLYDKYIINSFIIVEKYDDEKIYDSRLSNGPTESLNRKIKDLKRLGLGFHNFEHFRNRFLFATRNNPLINESVDSKPVIYYE